MNQLKIFTKTKLTEEEKSSLFGWGEDLWNNDRYALTWRRPDVKFVGYVGGRGVTHSCAVLHSIVIADKEVRLGGLAGVITHPEARGKGYGGQIVSAAEDYIHTEMRADFGVLFCHPELIPFYEPRGWHTIRGPITIDQPEGPRVTPHIVMVMPFTQAVWQDRPLTLGSLPW
jgi:GNAT superfamily N-acetyltransferase